jgi:hypothetical protein
MHESIKTMWEEATHSMWPRPGKFTAGEYDRHLEKFAELIIAKCASVAEEHDCNQSGAAGEILNHFGVKR